jgi:hypothetical protein
MNVRSESKILENASGREVVIVFADDPDVRVQERMPSGDQPRVSMEIKGGADASNVYNRIGEAEKSHLKAKQVGFPEFWTIVRADFSHDRARVDSPTTTHFFRLDSLADASHSEYALFQDRLCASLGIPTRPPRRRRPRRV